MFCVVHKTRDRTCPYCTHKIVDSLPNDVPDVISTNRWTFIHLARVAKDPIGAVVDRFNCARMVGNTDVTSFATEVRDLRHKLIALGIPEVNDILNS